MSWRTVARGTQSAEAATKALAEEHEKGRESSQGVKAEAEENARQKTEALNDRLEGQRLRLLGLPTDEAVQDFNELKLVWEGLNEAEKGGDRCVCRIAAHSGRGGSRA